MLFVTLSAIGVLMTLLARDKWRSSSKLLFIGLTISGYLALYLVYNLIDFNSDDSIDKGFFDVLYTLPWLEAGLFFSMLAGMVSKYIYDAIGDENQIEIQKWQLVKPFFVSPIVFMLIYGNMDEGASSGMLLIFSFQNGFFWKTVLEKKK